MIWKFEKFALWWLAVSLLYIVPLSAFGELIDLATPPEAILTSISGKRSTGEWYTHAETQESFIFEDAAAFELTFVDIELNPRNAGIYVADLYSIIGTDTPGLKLKSGSIAIEQTGRGFYRVPISHSFDGAGVRYLLNMSWSSDVEELTAFSFEGVGDFDEGPSGPYLAGPVRVIDGKSAWGIKSHELIVNPKYAISHFRIGIIPEPSGILLTAIAACVMSANLRPRFSPQCACTYQLQRAGSAGSRYC